MPCHKFFRLCASACLIIGITIGILVVLYHTYPSIYTVSYVEDRGTIIFMASAFFVLSALLYSIVALTKRLWLLFFQPIIYVVISGACFLLIRTAQYAESVGAFVVGAFFDSMASLFLYYSLATIPAAIFFYIYRSRIRNIINGGND